MATSRVTLPALAVVFIAGLVALHDTQNLLACLSGLTLLVALLAYDQRGARTGIQSLAFAFVCGLAVLLAVLYPLGLLLSGFALTPQFPALVWLIGAGAFWFIDRARMGSRQSANFAGYAQPAVTPVAASVYPAASYPAAPAPVPLHRTFTATAAPEPAAEPVVEPPPIAPADPVTAPMPTPPPPARPPVATGQGKEVSIYVNLLGEGMNVLRVVRAEHLGRDFYMIVEEMPAGETWEYMPGQVVRCRKKNLSSGKGLVAYEEAPRAQ